MRKIAMLLILGLCLGCTEPEPNIKIDLKFRRGQVVDLKIGGKGQIVDINFRGYRVRVQTDEGPKYVWFREFELEITPWEPS